MFSKKKDREGTGEIALTSSEGGRCRDIQGFSLTRWKSGAKNATVALNLVWGYIDPLALLSLVSCSPSLQGMYSGVRDKICQFPMQEAQEQQQEKKPIASDIVLGSDSLSLWEVLTAPYQH